MKHYVWLGGNVLQRSFQEALLLVPTSNNLTSDEVSRNHKPPTGELWKLSWFLVWGLNISVTILNRFTKFLCFPKASIPIPSSVFFQQFANLVVMLWNWISFFSPFVFPYTVYSIYNIVFFWWVCVEEWGRLFAINIFKPKCLELIIWLFSDFLDYLLEV